MNTIISLYFMPINLFLLYIYVKKLNVLGFEGRFSLGFMGIIWFLYEYVLFPVLAPVVFDDKIGIYNSSIWFLCNVVISVYLLTHVYAICKVKQYHTDKIVVYRGEQSSDFLMGLIYILSTATLLYIISGLSGGLNIITIYSNELTAQAKNDFSKSAMYSLLIVRSFFYISAVFIQCKLLSKGFIKLSIVFLFLNLYVLLLFKSKMALMQIFIYLGCYHYFYKKITFKLIISLLVLLVSFIPIINVIRRGGAIDLGGGSDYLYTLFKIILWRADFYHGLHYLLDKAVSLELPLTMGLSSLGVVTRFIPRSIWEDRVGSSEIYLTEFVFGKFEHVSGWSFNFGGLGEFILNFWFFGVPIIGLLSGYIIANLHVIFVRSFQEKNFLLFSTIITSALWSTPWNIGFNTTVATNVIPIFFAFIVIYTTNYIIKGKWRY